MAHAKIYKVGKTKPCDIVIEHDSIDAVHAEFFIDPDNNVFLTDLSSQYGSYVNDIKLSESAFLNKNDIVYFGDKQFFDWECFFLKKQSKPNPYLKTNETSFSSNNLLKNYWDIILIYGLIILVILVVMLRF